ncbi:hypothetical protein ACHAXS_002919 [Conticribra weissflogii]
MFQVMFNLCNVLEFGGNLPSLVIKQIVSPIFPMARVITKSDVFRIHVKVMRLLSTFKKAQGGYDLFKSAMNGSDLTGSITNITDIRVDETYLLARRLWDDVLESYTNGNSNDAIMFLVD